MSITPFVFEGHEIRTAATEAGDVEFVATDLAKMLGHTLASDMTRLLDSDEKGYALVHTPGGDQRMLTVTEAGLYKASLLRQTGRMASTETKEFVKRFQRWVSHEVIPSIRKTGTYGQPALSGPELMARALLEAAETIKESDRARDLAIKEREAAQSYARELEPKADSYDQFLSGDGTYSVGTVAKMLGLSQNKLFNMLRNSGIFIAKGAMRNTPYQHYAHHFDVTGFRFTRSDGTIGNSYTTRVQPSGIQFISRKLGLPVQGVAA